MDPGWFADPLKDCKMEVFLAVFDITAWAEGWGSGSGRALSSEPGSRRLGDMPEDESPTTPSDGLASSESLLREVRLILKTWRCYRDRRVFQYLKHAVCRAEDSLTHQVLRRINPTEV